MRRLPAIPLILLLWTVLSAVSCWGYYQYQMSALEAKFIRHSAGVQKAVEEKLQTADAVLEGFAALQHSVDSIDFMREKTYAQHIVARYPHIYCLELIYRVQHKDLAAITRLQQRRGYPDFAVHGFSYEADRRLLARKDKPSYYPIVFMEPSSEQSRREVVGLDMDSTAGLRQILHDSAAYNRSMVTPPFHLIEGAWAYLIVRPAGVANGARKNSDKRRQSQPLYVALVVKAAALQPAANTLPKGFAVTLRHHARAPEDAAGILFQLKATDATALERWIFPVSDETVRLTQRAQPFVMTLRWQPGFAEFGWLGFFLLCLLLMLLLYLMLAAYRQHLRAQHSQRQNIRLLEDMADTDALTGLPNRRALDAALQRWHRQGNAAAHYGVLFLDIDNFKPVNDRFGHATGDLVLRLSADRLRSVVRPDDLLVRLGGDEFVILLKSELSSKQLALLWQRLQSAIETPIRMDGHEILLGVSIGIAYSPQDGNSIDALIKSADARMYEHKQEKKRSAPGSESPLSSIA